MRISKVGWWLLPVGLFCLLVLLLWLGLGEDPREIPSPLIGRAMPSFQLTRLLKPNQQVGPAQLKGKIAVLNVWASWCQACQYEHPFWQQQKQIPIYSLNYKDERASARHWLKQHGNPYRLSIFDPRGLLAIDLGVYGTPETFLLDANGIIRGKWIGLMTAQRWQDEVLPLVQQLSGQ